MNRKHMITVLVGILVVALVVTACGTGTPAPTTQNTGSTGTPASPEPTETPKIEELKIGVSEEPRIFDPDIDQGMLSRYHAIFTTLLTLNDNNEPAPYVAESWEFKDDTTLVVKLRQDVTWQDGVKLTADDVVYTFDRMSDPNRASTNYPRFEPWLEAVNKIDDYTVEFKLKMPYAPALNDLAGDYWLAPKHDIEVRGDDAYGQLPLGSGPYKVVEWKKDNYLTLEAYDGFFGGKPPFPKVTFRAIPDPYTRATAFLAGELDMIVDMPVQFVSQVSETPGVHIAKAPGDRIQFLQFPHVGARHADTPEIDDKRVRQALNYALDVKKIAETVGQGYFTPVPGPWAPSSWAYPDNAWDQAYTYDPDKARSLLAEAGYENGFKLYLGTSVGFSSMDKELMEATVPYFQDAGLDVDFLASDWSVYDGQRDNNVFSVYYLGLSGGGADPNGVVEQYMTSNGRARGFHGTDPLIDSVIFGGQTIMDFNERKAYYQNEVFPTILDIAPWVFLWSPTDLYGVSDKLEFDPVGQKLIDLMKVKVKE